MLDKIISGGQSGADQAGWCAARACGIATGGWMPKGFLTEEGPRPDFATLNACRGMGRPYLLIVPNRQVRPSDAAAWLRANSRVTVLNIASNRESKAPGIGLRVERFLTEVFARLRDTDTYTP